jgi:hypothetical protein
LTTDASDIDLVHIAISLAGISTANVQFLTAPWVLYPSDPNEVQFAQPQADAVFWALAHDTKLPKIAKKRSTKKGKKAKRPTAGSGGQLLTVSPSDVKVMVLNGSSGTNLTSQAATALTSRGFSVVGTGYAANTSYTDSVIQYATSADLPAANTLKQQFSSATTQLDPSLTPGTIQVILGSSFTKLAPPIQTSQAVRGLSTNYGGINATISCRNSAFYGYYDPAPSRPTSCAC